MRAVVVIGVLLLSFLSAAGPCPLQEEDDVEGAGAVEERCVSDVYISCMGNRLREFTALVHTVSIEFAISSSANEITLQFDGSGLGASPYLRTRGGQPGGN
jgi:hypothetical protein